MVSGAPETPKTPPRLVKELVFLLCKVYLYFRPVQWLGQVFYLIRIPTKTLYLL